jgi:Arc/MetJ family transcription regulator
MRTTLNIDDKLIHRAEKLTGIKEKTSLVRYINGSGGHKGF